MADCLNWKIRHHKHWVNQLSSLAKSRIEKIFTSISKIAYGEDIKQYFSVITRAGIIFVSEDLKKLNQLDTQPVLKQKD